MAANVPPLTDLQIILSQAARQLRRELDLPDVTVHVRQSFLDVWWVDGPSVGTAQLPIRRSAGIARTRSDRRHTSAMFGAALVTVMTRDPQQSARERSLAARWHLHGRCLLAEPFDPALVAQGQVLAAMAGVPSDARIAGHLMTWPWNMTLQSYLVAPWLLEAIAAQPRRQSV